MNRLYILFIPLLFSCAADNKEVELYFDLEKQVEKIVFDQLNSVDHSLTKIATMNAEMDTVVMQPDTTGWLRELDLFTSANINKTQNLDMYSVDDRPDEESNLTVRTFSHNNQGKANVKWLQIYFRENPETPNSLSLEYFEDNTGFTASRILAMEFEEVRGDMWLRHYSIKGYQKILGQDTVNFVIKGEISYQ